MDKKQQEFEASTGKHFSCGQDFCKQCGLCSHCYCLCGKKKKVKIGVLIDEDGAITVTTDYEGEVELLTFDSAEYIDCSPASRVLMDKIRQKIEKMQEI